MWNEVIHYLVAFNPDCSLPKNRGICVFSNTKNQMFAIDVTEVTGSRH